MAYTATGSVEGLAYAVHVDSTAREPVTGTPDVVTLLEAREGLEFEATPVGPRATLDLTDEASVLIALQDLTFVLDVEGDVPGAAEDPPVPGVVY